MGLDLAYIQRVYWLLINLPLVRLHPFFLSASACRRAHIVGDSRLPSSLQLLKLSSSASVVYFAPYIGDPYLLPVFGGQARWNRRPDGNSWLQFEQWEPAAQHSRQLVIWGSLASAVFCFA